VEKKKRRRRRDEEEEGLDWHQIEELRSGRNRTLKEGHGEELRSRWQ